MVFIFDYIKKVRLIEIKIKYESMRDYTPGYIMFIRSVLIVFVMMTDRLFPEYFVCVWWSLPENAFFAKYSYAVPLVIICSIAGIYLKYILYFLLCTRLSEPDVI